MDLQVIATDVDVRTHDMRYICVYHADARLHTQECEEHALPDG